MITYSCLYSRPCQAEHCDEYEKDLPLLKHHYRSSHPLDFLNLPCNVSLVDASCGASYHRAACVFCLSVYPPAKPLTKGLITTFFLPGAGGAAGGAAAGAAMAA